MDRKVEVVTDLSALEERIFALCARGAFGLAYQAATTLQIAKPQPVLIRALALGARVVFQGGELSMALAEDLQEIHLNIEGGNREWTIDEYLLLSAAPSAARALLARTDCWHSAGTRIRTH